MGASFLRDRTVGRVRVWTRGLCVGAKQEATEHKKKRPGPRSVLVYHNSSRETWADGAKSRVAEGVVHTDV